MKIGFILLGFILISNAHALRPISGIILGDIKKDEQYDPLDYVFQSIEYNTKESHNKKVQEYIGFYREGVNLNNSCEAITPTIFYSTDWKKEKAIQSVAASLRYIGLDLATRAMGKYANELTWSKDDYVILTENLINNFCSENMTVISKKLLKLNLLDNFEKPRFQLPTIKNNPYYTPKIYGINQSDYIKKREFALTVQSFIAFCSWSGDIENFGLLYKYLKNPFIMSFINRNITAKQIYYSKNKGTLSLKKTNHKERIMCKDILCRKVNDTEFKNNFPVMTGSSGLESDLQRIYCNLFKDLDLNEKLLDKKLVEIDKKKGEEEVNFEILNFISLLTGVPDFLVASERYDDAQEFLKDRIIDRWDVWANRASSTFSKDLLYEESLRVDLIKKNEYDYKVANGEFNLDFTLTLGEFDRSFTDYNMLDSKFNLQLTHNFIGWVKRQYNQAKLEKNSKEITKIKEKIHFYVDPQINAAMDKYLISPFAKGIEEIIVDELLSQIDLFRGDEMHTLSHKLFKIPVNIKYGLFALRYFSYKFNAKYR